MSMAHLGKGALRVAKNYTKGYSDVQSKVRDATSNDPWGPSGTQMNELSALTYNQNDFVEIMEMLDKRLNDKGKNWRHVFKALTVLDYILHSGSENVVIYWRDNAYLIKTLKEFQYVDEQSKDQGANVRQKAKDISNLLVDEARLRQERRGRAKMRDQLLRGEGGDGIPPDDGEFEGAVERRRTKSTPGGGRRPKRDDEDLNRAIELSKKSLADEQAKQGQLTAEEQDLLKALKLSEEEEAARTKAVEDANSRSLFDDNSQLTPANPFPGLQPQFTQLQPQFTAVPMQQQFTSFNPYAQMAQQQAMQDQWMSQQAEWQAQQQAQLQAQQQAQLQAQQQAQLQAQQQAQMQAQHQAQLLAQQQAEQQLAQQQAEWAAQQQQQQLLQQQQQAQFLAQQQQQAQFLAQQQQQPLLPQATAFGSNNPFAFGAPQAQQPQQPTISTSPPPSTTPAFTSSPSPAFQPSPSPTSAPASSVPKVRTDDGQHAHLANLFANRDDGLDTFGNIGALRFGHTAAGRLQQMQTGPASSNPFSQMTGPAGQQHPAQSDQPFFSL